jgi:hypothetical protein
MNPSMPNDKYKVMFIQKITLQFLVGFIHILNIEEMPEYLWVVLLKWYVEEETKELREAFEREILNWANVTSKNMFGCPCARRIFCPM